MKRNTRTRGIGALAAGLALLAGTTFSNTARADAQDDQFFNIEVIVNILDGAGVTSDEAREYVRRANLALKCAKINLQVIEINTDVKIGNDDGSFSRDEFEEAVEEGTNELNDQSRGDSAGKGVKIYFVDEAWEDEDGTTEDESSTNGWAYVCQPIATVEEVDGDTREEETGNILAHEIGHVLGVPGNGADPDGGLDGDYTDADRKNELMNGYSSRDCDGTRTVRGSDITDAQKEKMRCKAAERGTAVAKPDPATPAAKSRTEQSGVGLNPDITPTTGGGIRKVSMFANAFDPCFELELITRGIQGPDEFVQYTLVYDIDNNPNTGVQFGPVPGVERVIDIFSEFPGFPFAQGTDLTGQFPDPLPLDPVFGVSNLHNGGVENALLQGRPDGDVFKLCVPRDWLGVDHRLAPVVPVVALGQGPFGPGDEIPFPLDLEAGLRGPEIFVPPLLPPNEPLLPIDGFGFTPDGFVEIEIQELNLVAVQPVNVDGTLQLNLPLPPGIPEDFYFVTAFDPAARTTAHTIVNFGAAGCNPADIAPPFGVLDLGDVDAFITAFLGGDLLADVAPPFGVLDLGDIDTFINSFFAGCP
ncbi:MAG: GC-type dockerin domain-anchored protein [Planctomycetota bacterium]